MDAIVHLANGFLFVESGSDEIRYQPRNADFSTARMEVAYSNGEDAEQVKMAIQKLMEAKAKS